MFKFFVLVTFWFCWLGVALVLGHFKGASPTVLWLGIIVTTLLSWVPRDANWGNPPVSRGTGNRDASVDVPKGPGGREAL